MKVRLVPLIQGSRNLDAQILFLPPVLEISVIDNTGNEIFCDCDGFYLNHGKILLIHLFIIYYILISRGLFWRYLCVQASF